MRWWYRGACSLAVAAVVVAGSGAPPARSQTEKSDQAAEPRGEKVDVDAVRLEAIGALSSVNAQHTYLLIGAVSDAHVKGVYQGRQVRVLMKGVIQQTELLSGMLKKVGDGLEEDDGEYVDQIIEIHVLLQAQARALSAFAAGPVEEKADAFEAARQATLKALEKLMGTGAGSEPDQPASETGGNSAEGGKKPTEKDDGPPDNGDDK